MFTQQSFRFPILLCIVLLFASCNSNHSTVSVTTDTTGVSSADSVALANKTNASPQPQNLIGSYLNTLSVDAANFSKLPKKRRLAFRFYVDNAESILMNGWSTRGSVYPLNPDLTLTKGIASDSIKYQAGDYLGNLVLSKANIDTIKLLIKQDTEKLVLFIPRDPATASFKGQVTYDIVLAKDNTHLKSGPMVIKQTGITTNPSPPGTAH